MKTKSKVAIAATAILATGALGLALPSIAHDRAYSSDSSTSQERRGVHEDHVGVELSATITGIPSEVTSLRDAQRGAYFTVAILDDSATIAPSDLQQEANRRISIRPSFNADGTMVVPEISDGSIAGSLKLRAPQTEGIVKLALYPSDGSSAVMVTIETAADGTVNAVADGPLSVNYSSDVVAAAPERGERGGPGHKMGHHRGMHGHQGESPSY